MITLYVFSINIDSLVIESHSSEYDEYDKDCTGYATYNDDGFQNIYAESVLSAEDAERLVHEKARELRDKFSDVGKILHFKILKNYKD